MAADERLAPGSDTGPSGGPPPTAAGRAPFWSRPTAWKAVLVVVGYLVFYLLVGTLTGRLFDGSIDTDDLLATPASILLGLALPIAIGGAALTVFAVRRGWWSSIVGRQPVRGRRWMWLAPVLVLVAVVAHVAATDWGAWSGGQIASLALLGVCVGLTEELATRGIVVTMLRDAGHGERMVMVVSSLLFALMHTVNLLSGMEASTVVATVVYTFGFGACMYLAMRVTGTFWAAVVLHALTDPTTFLASGGVDTSTTSQGGAAVVVALLATLLIVALGIVAIFAVRGKAAPSVSS
ncbi:CPBP family intramembrane glutamic endopeptidase [Luteimicrobium sp. DT211]|uniref:CPBP family intramembrane glutamic endopeptidase n=1 Tax=Luteimicrobium sp. DT211 TaxID=3393412 RepID=UPI003CF66046